MRLIMIVSRQINFFFPSPDTNSKSEGFKVTGCCGMQNIIINNKIYFFESKNAYEINGGKLIIDGIEAFDDDPRIVRILDQNGKDLKPKIPTGFLQPSEVAELILSRIKEFKTETSNGGPSPAMRSL